MQPKHSANLMGHIGPVRRMGLIRRIRLIRPILRPRLAFSAMTALSVLAFALTATAAATTLYVAPNGNDAWSGALPMPNDGNTDGPIATLAGARDAVRKLKAAGPLAEPAEVLFADGVYPLAETMAFTPEDSGTEQCPITYVAAPNAKPVVSGGRAITGWQKGDGQLWVADIPEVREGKWYFHQLFVNGRRAMRAMLPP